MPGSGLITNYRQRPRLAPSRFGGAATEGLANRNFKEKYPVSEAVVDQQFGRLTLRLLLPAPAEYLVKLHETLKLVPLCLRQSQFGSKEGPLAIQDFEIRGGASPVAQIR